MSHTSAFAGAIVVVAGTVVGALVALPPRASSVALLGGAEGSPQPKTDAQRIDDLQRQIVDIAAKQKKLANEVDEIAKQEAVR